MLCSLIPLILLILSCFVSHILRSCQCHHSAFHASSRAEARKFFVGGNWKCNGSVTQATELVSMLNQSSLSTNTEVVVCPSQVHLLKVKEGLRADVAVGAQDCWVKGNGAFTGETSADMLTDMGVQWVLVGHSERREKGESDVEVATKAKYALDKGLSVIACCGEPLANREAGTTVGNCSGSCDGDFFYLDISQAFLTRFWAFCF